MTSIGSRAATITTATVVALACAGAALATHGGTDVEGHTTLEQVIAGVDADGNPDTEFQALRPEQVNEDYLLRDGRAENDDSVPNARGGREKRRRSLAYFAQTTDFQLVDEESPARVEFLDERASSAWRPAEAFIPFVIDASLRQINRFAPVSPVPEGNGSANEMDFVLVTGDQADNQHRNETVWVRELLEGGRPLNFNSGLTDPAAYTNPEILAGAGCSAFVAQEGGAAGAAAEGEGYTGVQDYSDYPALDPNATPLYYDPNDVRGRWASAGWPTYPGLMDRAQQVTLTPEGLDVPFYLTNGNHDALAQGNEDANQAFERIATGCEKVLASNADPGTIESFEDLFTTANAQMLVPPDPLRQYVSKPQIKEIYGADPHDEEDHGFGFVDPAEEDASNGSASYYAWDPEQTPGFRFVSIDTVSEGGVLGPFDSQPEPTKTGSSNGNIDDPQFRWLTRELDAAQAAGKLIVVFGHHPIRSLNSVIPDEAAPRCTVNDEHGHDVNPGCDVDPRSSEPLHLGDPEAADRFESNAKTLAELLAEYPNVVTYVPGHTHENRVIPYPKDNGSVFWEINTAAVIDHPQQSRLVEIFDNRDGTLSIFGTVLDHAAATATPPAGSDASGFSPAQLASIGRQFSWNDPQTGHLAKDDTDDPPIGFARDRNVELLVSDVRIAPRGSDRLRCAGKAPTIVGTTDDDRIVGTKRKDVIVTGPGNDVVKARGGNDIVCAGAGKDRVKGGPGSDRLKGMKGSDRLFGGRGHDRLAGGKGGDRLRGGKGRDRLNGGKGKDRLSGGKGRDRLNGGKGNDRLNGGKGRDRLNGGAGFDICRVHNSYDLRHARNCERFVGPAAPRASCRRERSSSPPLAARRC